MSGGEEEHKGFESPVPLAVMEIEEPHAEEEGKYGTQHDGEDVAETLHGGLHETEIVEFLEDEADAVIGGGLAGELAHVEGIE